MLDAGLPLEARARQAFELRNTYREQARNLMANVYLRGKLDVQYPIVSFEEKIKDKMERKKLTHDQALEDIIKTAPMSNANVNRELGMIR